MDIIRRFTDELPEAWTFRHDKPTLLVSWWCTFYALTVIIIRVCGRYIRTEKVFIEDAIMMGAIIPLFIRMGLAHLVLVKGTNNVDTTGLTAQEIDRRVTGSQVVLASRIVYTIFLWTIKLSFSHFLRTLTESVWQRSHQRMLRWLHIVLAATFVACVVSDLAPCQPFSHNWQVVPDPGAVCRQGYGHLLTNGILNILTNVMLVCFPIPMIFGSTLPKRRKFTIMIRMALPLLNICMTLNQILRVTHASGAQPIRTLLASLDILLVTFTSNSAVLFSLLKDRGYKKSKYRHVTELTSISRTPRPGTGARKGGSGVYGESDDDLIALDGDKDAVGMRVLKIDGMGFVVQDREGRAGELVNEDHEIDDDGRKRRRRSIARKKDDDVLSPLPSAKLQDIRVATTWEISHEVDDRRGRSVYDDV